MAGIAYSPRQFQRLLKDNGYRFDHQTGDHRIWYKGKRHISVTASKLNPIVAQRLIKEYGLEVR